ncbi:MAG: hypothetical protein A3C02_02190 [Candidatus Andersenbacteria bacterium RIFCSPHIGHO2_02_FULL_45_11]|uniref:DUF5658 domain-containing protein n=1 Tax=Candidatus Andersenbacteria bacterium RIFCSPHIGHO2_12_FULL_45_11 TaxID=1797281 RepID=A0A1G1X1S5_9BACT|nr:MAG: hypothetical protein A2805_02645 [Candidatus Andersenbacteria bacterium RIFCSPHIGHO2_01_FULL_46_36]OGY32538.1 MAG: hypothetical protein A3C02_02190 [Candidatus Andersenbacteria bacterium RIFCSPHIGHO2_02_FULL_45_11]OGY33923.1 MAG: hypothetical protein A3D99_01675 [Candidatus Andersenbacteria bacterium RIFCSPHIGHO2_12_FULL_45_11]
MNSRAFNARNIFFASVACNLVLWIIVLATFPKDSPTAILHYTAGIGVDFIGDGWQIVTLPGIGTLLLVVNIVLARFVEKTSPLAFWILWGSVPVLECVLLATYGILLTLNT